MSIVPVAKLKNDPQTLLYHFPSMHPVRYQKLIQEYTYWKHVETAEKVARLSGRLLVPRDCIHWQRKGKYAEQRVIIHKKAFFVLLETEMTPTELKKYREGLF
ncbi:hypothetical protein [Paenibacillus agricola]|uniref:Uncharacterized protein n=1 Tax=Paenibacillus agricola TaxID=2716264 RepID=A0ABX0JHV1_9BACL|nr:hypothetical protein [Paenibacillus agricola]NHN35558.1 hypothetical protein [Paenibacillus agricola]